MSGTPRDCAAPEPLPTTPARRRARRIPLGCLAALIALLATPPASLGEPRLLQDAFAPAQTGGLAAVGMQTASISRVRPARRPPRRRAYVDPLPGGFAAGRTDMGVDFTARAGAPILAIGRAKILGIHPGWYPPGGPNGGNLLEYKLLNGRDAGRSIYVAEQIAVAVHPGQTVRAGAVIGRYAASGTGIETGWAAGGGTTLAQASTGYNEGEVTSAGISFRRFLGGLRATPQARYAHAARIARRSPASGASSQQARS